MGGTSTYGIEQEDGSVIYNICRDSEFDNFILSEFMKGRRVDIRKEDFYHVTSIQDYYSEELYEYEDSVTSNANKHQEGGKIWMAYADMTIKLENGTFSIKPLDFYENDSCVVDVKVLNRRSSGIIRNAVINEFKSDYDIYFQGDGRSEKHHFENANEAIDAIFAKHGLSSEYGISYEDIYEHILRTPSNVFRFKD